MLQKVQLMFGQPFDHLISHVHSETYFTFILHVMHCGDMGDIIFTPVMAVAVGFLYLEVSKK